jgi:hypothetical protein
LIDKRRDLSRCAGQARSQLLHLVAQSAIDGAESSCIFDDLQSGASSEARTFSGLNQLLDQEAVGEAIANRDEGVDLAV